MVHLFIELDKPLADRNGILECNGELQLLMQVVDRSVESLVAFHHQICSSFQTMGEIGQGRKKPGVGQKISKPRRQQSVQRDTDKLSQRSKKRLLLRRRVPGVYLASVREG